MWCLTVIKKRKSVEFLRSVKHESYFGVSYDRGLFKVGEQVALYLFLAPQTLIHCMFWWPLVERV